MEKFRKLLESFSLQDWVEEIAEYGDDTILEEVQDAMYMNDFKNVIKALSKIDSHLARTAKGLYDEYTKSRKASIVNDKLGIQSVFDEWYETSDIDEWGTSLLTLTPLSKMNDYYESSETEFVEEFGEHLKATQPKMYKNWKIIWEDNDYENSDIISWFDDVQNLEELSEAQSNDLSKKEIQQVIDEVVAVYSYMIIGGDFDADEDEVDLDAYNDYLESNGYENSPKVAGDYIYENSQSLWHNNTKMISDEIDMYLESAVDECSNAVQKKFKTAVKNGQSQIEYFDGQVDGQAWEEKYYIRNETYSSSKAFDKLFDDMGKSMAVAYSDEY